MSPLEICLIIVGVMCIAVSFIFVGKDDNTTKSQTVLLSETQIEQVTKQIDAIIDEQMDGLEERTEVSMEKISNQKIMELGEYADTVLEQINKNHTETMFLYDMLNNKTKDVKKVISDSKKEFNSSTNIKADEAVKKIQEEPVIKQQTTEDTNVAETEPVKKTRTRKTTKSKTAINKNEQILKLYNEGKTSVEIAKILGLGTGEVKLVIDLFKGENE